MDERKYRVAVVGGPGTWGRHYLGTFAQLPRCHVVLLVDRARDGRQDLADRFQVPAVFDEAGELLARQVPDIVSVILPVAYSAGVVLQSAEAGVQVVSFEKPIAARLSHTDALIGPLPGHHPGLRHRPRAPISPHRLGSGPAISAP